MGDSKSDPVDKLVAVFCCSVFGLMFLFFSWMCGTYIYEAFYTPADFDQLAAKEGILTKVGKCRRNGSLIYIPVEVIVGDIAKKFKLPCKQDLPSLPNEIGNRIEIRYDPSHLSFPGCTGMPFLEELNIWHVSTTKKTYFDYTIALTELESRNKHRRNIFYIISILSAIIILKNFKQIKKCFLNMQTKRSFIIDDLKGTHKFQPDRVNPGCCCYILVMAAIISVYSSIFIHPLYLFGAIFFTLLAIPVFNYLKKHKYTLTVSPIGIRYTPFRKNIKTDTIRWSDIKSIRSWRQRYGTSILVELVDRTKTSSIRKFEPMGRNSNIVIRGFEESDRLNDTICRMLQYYNKQG